MAALMKNMEWPVIALLGKLEGTPGLRLAGRIAAHLLGWPLLVKAGLLTGFALSASVQHLLAI